MFSKHPVAVGAGTAAAGNGAVSLTDLGVKRLRLFFTREGEVLTRAELLPTVWGLPPDAGTRTLDSSIVGLRKYFEPDPSEAMFFPTVRGRVHRFVRNGEE